MDFRIPKIENIILYPNESYYEKYLNKMSRVNPIAAMKAANETCEKIQKNIQ